MRVIFALFVTISSLFAQVSGTTPSSPSATPAAEAPQPVTKPEDKGIVSGQVFNLSGEPLRKANLVLMPDRPTGRFAGPILPASAATDAEGKFQFTDVDPGVYRLMVNRSGFVSQQYGAKGPNRPGTTLTLPPGGRIADLQIRLTPHAVILGKVTDEDGDPVVFAQVQILRQMYQQGKRRIAPMNGASTNDLGEFRIHSLSPGRYYLSVTPQTQGMMYGAQPSGKQAESGYATVYYPNALDMSSAAQLEVTGGAEMRGIDFRLQRVRTFAIRGRVLDGRTNRPVRQGVGVQLMRQDVFMMGRPIGNAVAGQEGAFDMRGVAPGSYTLMAFSGDNNRPLVARLPIEVGNSNIDSVTLTMMPGFAVQGSVKIEGQTDKPLGTLNLALTTREDLHMPMSGGNAQVKEDNTFEIQNIGPALYTVVAYGMLPQAYLKSATLGEQEVLESGVDLTQGASGTLQLVISMNGGQVEGSVTNGEGKPVNGTTVALIPETRRRHLQYLYKQANTDQNGHFSIQGVAPGEYKLFAWDDIEPGAYQDPEFVKQYENAGETVAVKEGAKETKDLKLIVVKP